MTCRAGGKDRRGLRALHIAFNNAGTEGRFGLITTEQTVEHYHQICDIDIRRVLLSTNWHEMSKPYFGPAMVPLSLTPPSAGTSAVPARRFTSPASAVIGLTKTAALEFARQGVRVNSVSPGPIQTEMFDRSFGEGETDVKKMIATQNPLGRIGTPEEIATAVLLAQFTRCGVHHGPGHHRGRWIYRAIAECELPMPRGFPCNRSRTCARVHNDACQRLHR